MPKDTSVGFSEITQIKQNELRNLFKKQIAIIDTIKHKQKPRLSSWSDFTFNFIDTTAGVGLLYNGQKGSPLIFLDEVAKVTKFIKFNIILIEQNREAFKRLVSSIFKNKHYREIVNQQNVNLKVFNNDNIQILTKYFYAKEIVDDRVQYGFIYTDPNGTPDFEMIKFVTDFKIASTLDVIINFNLTQAKRNRAAHSHIEKHMKPLEEYLVEIKKKYWFIKPLASPFITDKWHWHYIIGTNYKKYRLNRSYARYTKVGRSLKGNTLFANELMNTLSYF